MSELFTRWTEALIRLPNLRVIGGLYKYLEMETEFGLKILDWLAAQLPKGLYIEGGLHHFPRKWGRYEGGEGLCGRVL